eukprot:UN03886
MRPIRPMRPSLNANRNRDRMRNRRTRNNNKGGSTSDTEALIATDSQGHRLKGASHSQTQMMLRAEPQYNEQKALEAQHIEGQLTEITQMM